MIVYVVWSHFNNKAISYNFNHLNITQKIVCMGSCSQNVSFTSPYVLKHYLHSSVNSPTYERKCFERFGALLEYMKVNNLKKVMHLDSDIILQDTSYYNEMMKYTNSLILKKNLYYRRTDASTYMMVISIEALQKFVDFMTYVFDNKHEYESILHKYGVSVRRCCPYYKGKITRQLSDMQLFMAFSMIENVSTKYFSPIESAERVNCMSHTCQDKKILHFQGSCKRHIGQYIKNCLKHEHSKKPSIFR